MLHRIKALKDLFLNKLDEILRKLERLEEVSTAMQELTSFSRRLDSIAEAQLENQTALLEASIRTLKRLDKPTVPAILLLGNAGETASALGLLQSAAASIRQMEWDWGQDLDGSAVGDRTQIILCKLPTEPHHWESVQKLQQQLPGCLGIFSWIGLKP